MQWRHSVNGLLGTLALGLLYSGTVMSETIAMIGTGDLGPRARTGVCRPGPRGHLRIAQSRARRGRRAGQPDGRQRLGCRPGGGGGPGRRRDAGRALERPGSRHGQYRGPVREDRHRSDQSPHGRRRRFEGLRGRSLQRAVGAALGAPGAGGEGLQHDELGHDGGSGLRRRPGHGAHRRRRPRSEGLRRDARGRHRAAARRPRAVALRPRAGDSVYPVGQRQNARDAVQLSLRPEPD